MSSKDISHHIVKYWKIFVILLICTFFTVFAAEMDFDVQNSIAGGIFVGLAIATFKGYLVASNFMLTILLTFFLSLFGAICPLFLWIIDREKEKIKLHRFILGLSLASSIVTFLLVLPLKISQISIITIFIWVILFN